VLGVPEICYRFIYPKDTAGPTFEIMTRDVDNAATSATVTISITGVPKDRVLVLQNVNMFADPGAGQAVVQQILSGFTPAGLQFTIARTAKAAIADLNDNLNWQGAVYLPGLGDGVILSALTVYDAGVASNALTFSMQGVVIPRGNSAAF